MEKLIIIDNYDSFTYTIKSYFEYLQINTEVIKNDDVRLNCLEELEPTCLVLSPGPGCPEEAGMTLQIIQRYYSLYPILGICLGHQCLLQAFGAKIVPANEVAHGKVSKITHTGAGIFTDIPQDFNATRYHSLIADITTIPENFAVTAWSYDREGNKVVMACEHRQYPVFGVQYHPEAILTEHGYTMFKNFSKIRLIRKPY